MLHLFENKKNDFQQLFPETDRTFGIHDSTFTLLIYICVGKPFKPQKMAILLPSSKP